MFNKYIYLTVTLCFLPFISNAETQSVISTVVFSVTAVKDTSTLTTITPATENKNNLPKEIIATGLRQLPVSTSQQHDQNVLEQHVRIVWESAN